MKTTILLIVAAVLTIACNARADVTPRPMPVHVVRSPQVRPVTHSVVIRDTSAASPLTAR